MSEYFDNKVAYKYFYNESIKKKVHNFYKNDFVFFEKHGFKYDIVD